jgi:hypothetical protein
MPLGGVDDVGLNQQIVAQELGRLAAIGFYSTDFCGGQIHLLRPLLGKETFDRDCRPQIEFGAIAKQEMLRTISAQAAHDCGSHEAPMAGYEDGRILHGPAIPGPGIP